MEKNLLAPLDIYRSKEDGRVPWPGGENLEVPSGLRT